MIYRIAAAIIIVLAVVSSSPAQSGPVWGTDLSVQPVGLMVRCPCTADSFFAAFVAGERELLTCTDDTPATNFVRLVATNLDLVVLYEFPPQMYCGFQPAGDYTSPTAITPAQFRACRRLFLQAAAAQGLSCLPE